MSRLIDADEIKIRLPFKLPRYNMMLLRNSIRQGIQDTPTVDAEPVRHRHWILKDDFFARCSNCGHQTFERKVVNCWADQYWERFEMPRYCPNCGRKMDEEADDE